MEMILMSKFRFGILLFIALLALLVPISSAMPITADATINYLGTPSPAPAGYFDVNVLSTLPIAVDPDLKVKHYPGWCADSQIGTSFPITKTFKVFSSLDYPGPAELSGVDWNRINFVLNNNVENADAYTLQQVFWHYDGGLHSWHTYDTTKYANLLIAAIDQGNFKPTCGQKYAIALYFSGTTQRAFVVEELPKCVPPPSIPEFPTFALPAGMIVGLFGLVYFVKGREN
jgi:hypothetical protein